MTLMTGIFVSVVAGLIAVPLMIGRYVVTAEDMEGY